MVTTILSQEVKDYNTWKKVFQEDLSNQAKLRVRVKRLNKLNDNPKIVSMIYNKKQFAIEQVN